ncbi:MAG: DRTGG domain-containing protein [Clostridia bacterium]
MKLSKILEQLSIKELTDYIDVDVEGAYTSDLLSDVIANAKESQLWITLHGHQNLVAVALLKDLAGIIITGGYKPDPTMIEKAKIEQIAVFKTDLKSFEISGKLYQLLNKNES